MEPNSKQLPKIRQWGNSGTSPLAAANSEAKEKQLWATAVVYRQRLLNTGDKMLATDLADASKLAQISGRW